MNKIPKPLIHEENLDEIFHPRSIAIVGASENVVSFGYQCLRYLCKGGYRGKIYPIAPQKKKIMGLRVYKTLGEVPGNIDYVICCINANMVIDLLRECTQKKVKAVHLFTGRLSETGDSNRRGLEKDILSEAQKLGIHLIGPNCMGIYNPRERITFNHDLCMEPGTVGAIVQSGGIAGEFVRYTALRGVRFSKVISYGNASDLNECDFLEYFLCDKETKIILMYIEGVREGKRFVKTLRDATRIKPVIILKGGRTKAGSKSIASHTASIAGSINIWGGALRQARAIQARNLNELIDFAVAFYFLPPITGKRVGIIGGGGGNGVLLADEFEEAGLDVISIPEQLKKLLESRSPILAKWVGNPVDFSILHGFNVDYVEVVRSVAQSPDVDLLIANITGESPYHKQMLTTFLEKEVNAYLTVAKEELKPIAVVMKNPELVADQARNWRWQILFKQRERFINNHIPVFSSHGGVAGVIRKMVDYYQGIEADNFSTV